MCNVTKPSDKIINAYGNKLRVRVCGLCIENGKILSIKHNMGSYELWSPPGGGMEFGTDAITNLKREFKEETGLDVEVGDFLFTTEHIAPPLHALELFFSINSYRGNLKLGTEPEIENENIIKKLKFLSADDIKAIPAQNLHKVFRKCTNPIELLQLKGYLY